MDNINGTDYVYCGPGWTDFWRPFNSIRHYAHLIISLVGTLTNILNVVVLTRKKMRMSPTNNILTALAISDFLFTFKRLVDRSLHFHNNNHGDSRTSYRKEVEGLIENISYQLFHTWAIYLTLLLAIVRFLCVWCPLRTRNLYTIKVARGGILVAVLIGSIFVSLLFVHRHVGKKDKNIALVNQTEVSNLTMIQNQTIIISEHHQDHVYEAVQNEQGKQIRNWVQGWLIKVIPCILLTILTMGLIWSLVQTKRNRTKLTGGSNPKEFDKTTIMLLVILVIFIISEFPFGIFRIGTTFVQQPKTFYDQCTHPAREFFHFCELVSSSTSFFVYLIMNEQFRQTLQKTCLKIRIYLTQFKLLSRWSTSSSQVTGQQSRHGFSSSNKPLGWSQDGVKSEDTRDTGPSSGLSVRMTSM